MLGSKGKTTVTSLGMGSMEQSQRQASELLYFRRILTAAPSPRLTFTASIQLTLVGFRNLPCSNQTLAGMVEVSSYSNTSSRVVRAFMQEMQV